MKLSILSVVPIVGLAMSSAAFAGGYGKDTTTGYSGHDEMQQTGNRAHPIEDAPNAIIESARQDRGLFFPNRSRVGTQSVQVTTPDQNEATTEVIEQARDDRGRFVPETTSSTTDVVGLSDPDFGAPNRIIEDAVEDRGLFVPRVEDNS